MTEEKQVKEKMKILNVADMAIADGIEVIEPETDDVEEVELEVDEEGKVDLDE